MYRHNFSPAAEQVTVRRAGPADRSALERLAALDSGSVPQGPALVAESESRLLAALPLGSGRPIADPFEPTAELVAVLELRRAQLQRGERPTARSTWARVWGRLSFALPAGRTGP